MEDLNSIILIISGIIFSFLINYGQFFKITKSIFNLSGFLFFKYLFRLLISVVFIYLLIYSDTQFSKPEINNNSILYVIKKSQFDSNLTSLNFKNYVLNDLKNLKSQSNNFSIAVFDVKTKIAAKITPNLNADQMVFFLENNASGYLNGYAKRLTINSRIFPLISNENFQKFELIGDELIIEKKENLIREIFLINKLDFIFNLKVYLLILLIVLMSVDILISIKIIKI